MTAQEALDVIPRAAGMYDEPFADSSQIPTFLVSAMTRQHVTVALSGDGGDELFAGYNRYQLDAALLARLSLLPRAIRQGMAAAMTSVSPDRWSRLLGFLPVARCRRRSATSCTSSPPSSRCPTATPSTAGWSRIGSPPR